MFDCSSQRPNTAERAGIKSLLHSSVNETVLGSGRKPGGAAENLIDGCQNAFVDWALNFRVRSKHCELLNCVDA